VGAAKVQKLFEETKATVAAAPAPGPRALTEHLAGLYAEGKLERAELILAESGARTDLTRAESGQLFVHKGLLQALKGLQRAGPAEGDRAKAALEAEGQLKAVDERLKAGTDAPLSEAESAQRRQLEGFSLVVKGLVKAESGDQAQAKAAFERGLALSPGVGLPAVAGAGTRQLFEAARVSSANLVPGTHPPFLPFLDQRASAPRRTGWGLTMGGAALLASGLVAGLVAYSAVESQKAAAQAGDYPRWRSSRDTAVVAINVADGLYIGGAVALGAGGALLLATQGEGAGAAPLR
jgi:hypothetical protein